MPASGSSSWPCAQRGCYAAVESWLGPGRNAILVSPWLQLTRVPQLELQQRRLADERDVLKLGQRLPGAG